VSFGMLHVSMKTFAEANEALRQFWPDRLTRPNVYTLDTIIPLMDYLGNLQEKLKIIHVAGTSGKTSTTYYAAALLKAAGKRVGFTTSPHVDEVNERVQINAEPMPERAFCSELSVFLELIKKSGLEPSYFEVLVAFVFWEFVRSGMEYAVIEVGLGGLTDATNVIRRPDKVCVITDIGLDHTNRLGSTLAEITEKKAGIIQLHNSVFCYRQASQIMEQIIARARQQQADLHILGDDAAQSNLDFLPLFQQRNLGLARAAVDYLLRQNGEDGLTDEMVAEAAKIYIPARMEEVPYGGRTIIVDGAHNAQKLHALAESVRRKYPDKKIAAIVSFVGNRTFRLDDSARELAQLLDHVIITSFSGPQDGPHVSEDPEGLAQLFRRHGVASVEVVADPGEAFTVLLTRPEPILLVTGSFYLLNHIRPLLKKQ
jgi:dihydrofolate synthase/folylpolyglutamate synthase